MPLKRHKPTSPGRRFATYSDFAEVTRAKPEKSLTEGIGKSGGGHPRGRKTPPPPHPLHPPPPLLRGQKVDHPRPKQAARGRTLPVRRRRRHPTRQLPAA